MELHKPNDVFLLVRWLVRRNGKVQELPVGIVMLGHVRAGKHTLHWDLHVNGQPLPRDYVYFVTMHNLISGLGTSPAVSGGEYLSVSQNGYTTVGRRTPRITATYLRPGT